MIELKAVARSRLFWLSLMGIIVIIVNEIKASNDNDYGRISGMNLESIHKDNYEEVRTDNRENQRDVATASNSMIKTPSDCAIARMNRKCVTSIQERHKNKGLNKTIRESEGEQIIMRNAKQREKYEKNDGEGSVYGPKSDAIPTSITAKTSTETEAQFQIVIGHMEMDVEKGTTMGGEGEAGNDGSGRDGKVGTHAGNLQEIMPSLTTATPLQALSIERQQPGRPQQRQRERLVNDDKADEGNLNRTGPIVMHKEKLMDQLKLRDIVTDAYNQPTTTSAITSTPSYMQQNNELRISRHSNNAPVTDSKIIQATIETDSNRNELKFVNRPKPIRNEEDSLGYNDFTGKLLAEKDVAIKEIEQKFRLREYAAATSAQTINNEDSGSFVSASSTPAKQKPQSFMRDQMIERRVKKSFEFPMHLSSNRTINAVSRRGQIELDELTSTVQPSEIRSLNNNNNKISYRKMEMKNKIRKVLNMEHDLQDSAKMSKILQLRNISAFYRNLTMRQTQVPSNFSEPQQHIRTTTETVGPHPNSTVLATAITKMKRGLISTTLTSATSSITPAATATVSTITTTTRTDNYGNLPEHFTTLATTYPLSNASNTVATIMDNRSTVTYRNRGALSTNSSQTSKPLLINNPRKSITRAIVHSDDLSFLQEKISSLECDVPVQPQNLQIWRSNTTHELILPIMTPENCKIDMECSAMMVSWEGESEIQSGDILIIEINDTLLSPKELITNNSDGRSRNVQVYQVTRSGHEHCDVTEGILLDIMPLIFNDKKIVTLYDKDLTEGVNFLIVVYEDWGSQCVRLKVTTKTDNCGDNADCSAKGLCYSSPVMEEYECLCCNGFSGSHCEEIDACTPSPCTNNGICVDLSQGHEGNSYQCLCPYGYTGKNCQYELDPCNPSECLNGGSCVGNSTHFRCECLAGFIGPLCQHSLNKCESSPCIHGICVDQEDGFRCFCQPGFAGELCNFEYNECESNPCQNQGECIDHIGSYECRCTKGYTGSRCQIKVDFCANKPCPSGHNCLDHGNDYSCECPGGRNGPNCNQIQRIKCNVNPCTHGGTCWSSGESFYCACRPGYTGTMCEDEFVVETVISSSEFIVDDSGARNLNEKPYESAVVIKSPIELHNAYFAAAVLAAAIFIVATVVTICHCKVNQTYRKFSTRSYGFIPILGFGRRQPIHNKFNKHWLSGKSGASINGNEIGGNRLRSTTATMATMATTAIRHQNLSNSEQRMAANAPIPAELLQHHQGGQLHERPFQRHMPINLENDMYYTVDFGETTQHSPLIQ